MHLFENSGAGWTAVRVLPARGGFGGRLGGSADRQPYTTGSGLQFRGDGTGLVVADWGNNRVSLFRMNNGSLMRHAAIRCGEGRGWVADGVYWLDAAVMQQLVTVADTGKNPFVFDTTRTRTRTRTRHTPHATRHTPHATRIRTPLRHGAGRNVTLAAAPSTPGCPRGPGDDPPPVEPPA